VGKSGHLIRPRSSSDVLDNPLPTTGATKLSSADEIDVKFESRVGDPGDSWLRLQYVVHDYWSGEACEIDDKIFLATSRPPFGGLRWWFVCPRENRRVRKLHLPLGGRHFWSRRAYELAYASQRETKYDRALRRARKLR
jgi:hypothetical protein